MQSFAGFQSLPNCSLDDVQGGAALIGNDYAAELGLVGGTFGTPDPNGTFNRRLPSVNDLAIGQAEIVYEGELSRAMQAGQPLSQLGLEAGTSTGGGADPGWGYAGVWAGTEQAGITAESTPGLIDSSGYAASSFDGQTYGGDPQTFDASTEIPY